MMNPLKWKCAECDSICTDEEMLMAANPFDTTDNVCGCPNCKAVNSLSGACDEPGCKSESSCGFPTNDGYRRTCHEHYTNAVKTKG